MTQKQSTPNEYAIGFSAKQDLNQAAEEAVNKILTQLGDSVDLLNIFSVGHNEQEVEDLFQHTRRLTPQHMTGCHAVGAISGSRELFDGEPALALWAAKLPETQLKSFHLLYQQEIGGGTFVGWPDGYTESDEPTILLALGDPYSFPMDLLLNRLNEDRPNVQVVGGMASGSSGPGQWSLFHNHEPKKNGASVVAFQGSHLPVPLVSQGCRPVGKPMIITAAERNEIHSLGGKPAVEQLIHLFDQLPTREQKLLNTGLQLGIAVSEYKDSFGYGDFLVRNVTGYDKNSGTLNIGAFVRVGQTVQFHVRDHETAGQDLIERCEAFQKMEVGAAKSALLFSCNGRGPNLFPEPHHDSTVLCQQLGIQELAGFFAAGEVGPVGGSNFVHGFTASAALFL